MRKAITFFLFIIVSFTAANAQSGKNYLNVDGTVKDSFFVGKKHNFAMLFDRSQRDSLKQNTIATWDTVKKVWVKSEGLKSMQDSIAFHRYEMNMYSTKIDQNATDIDFQAGRIGRHDDSIYIHRAQLNVNADSIKSLVTKTSVHDGKLSQQQAELNVQAGEISLRVKKDEVISSINLTSEAATINANKIQLNGDVLIKNINGNSDGTSISAGKIKTTDITALGRITAGSFYLGNGKFSVSPEGVLSCSDANITGSITSSAGTDDDFRSVSLSHKSVIFNGYYADNISITPTANKLNVNASISANDFLLGSTSIQTLLNGKASSTHTHSITTQVINYLDWAGEQKTITVVTGIGGVQ